MARRISWVVLLMSLSLFGGWLPLLDARGETRPSSEHETQKTFNVVYAERAGRPIRADVFVPAGRGPFPAVLLIHGGAWMSGSKLHMRGTAAAACRQGYTAMAINYRLAPRHKFPAQIEDCREAVAWMRTNCGQYRIDPQRIAAYGYSAGGHLACLLGVTSDQQPAAYRVHAVVAGGAPCDLMALPGDARSLAYFLGGSRRERPEVYRQASPVSFVDAQDPPVWFFHGERDRLVPRSNAVALQQRLHAAQVPTEMHVVSGQGHLGTFFAREPVALALKFLDRQFKSDARASE